MMQRLSMIWRRLTIQMTADRRKFGVLCALTALGLLFWARIIVINNLPRTVLAEDGAQFYQCVRPPGGANNTRVMDRPTTHKRFLTNSLDRTMVPNVLTRVCWPPEDTELVLACLPLR